MLKIFNTLSSQKETFEPLQENKIGLYVCGVTVYDYCHLGHARTYVSVDVIVRYLKYLGFDVNYVRNITDIDDKIINRAKEKNVEYTEITAFFIKAMHEDFNALQLLSPTHEPLATNYIPQMIKLITRLIEQKHAYVGDNNDVYFDVRSYQAYGALSHHDLEQLESGVRVSVAEAKRDPLDFVLWKAAKAGEPAWDSPWGKGRPGWHIECSSMALELLGETFDLHGGGRDLIFPHHENEIAQSQAATNKTFARHWVHGGFLQIEKEKMSKSLGNFITIRDILKMHSPELVRFFLLSSHYRSPLIYTSTSLAQSQASLTRFYTALRFLPDAQPPANSIYEDKFKEAMNDDFNTPIAFSVLFELAHEIQRLKTESEEQAAVLGALLKKLGGVFGLLQDDPEHYFQPKDQDTGEIESLIAARERARQEKNWQEADRIRQQLTNMSITIEDTAKGTTWKKI